MSQYVYVIDCTTTPVTTASYLQVEPNVLSFFAQIQFVYYGASQASAVLAFGAAGSEVNAAVCSNGVANCIDLYVNINSRISVQAIGSDIDSGYLVVTLLNG